MTRLSRLPGSKTLSIQALIKTECAPFRGRIQRATEVGETCSWSAQPAQIVSSDRPWVPT